MLGLGACFRAPTGQSAYRDQEGVLSFDVDEPLAPEAAGAEATVEEAIGDDLLVEVQESLRQTRATLHWDQGPVDAEDRARIVRATYTDLSNYAVGDEGSDAPTDSAASSALEPCREAGVAMLESTEEEGSEDRVVDEAECPQNRASGSSSCQPRGLDPEKVESAAAKFVRQLGLRPQDVGSRNYSKWRGRTLWNQCFYMSMASGYLGHAASGRRVRGLALRLRRAIEAAVLEKHPQWAAGLKASTEGRGQAMVFADFLAIAMRCGEVPVERNFLSQLAVCVLDSVGGHVEVYIGPGYDKLKEPERESNLILLWYEPGHYQCVVGDDALGSKLKMSYAKFRSLLVESGVVFIETFE